MTRLRRRFRAPPWQPPQRRKHLMTSATCRDPSPPRFVRLRPGRLRRRLRPVQVRRVRPRAWASSTPPSSPSCMLRWRRLRPLAPSMLPSCRVCSLAPTRTRRDPCTGRWWQHSTRRLGRGRQPGRRSAPWGCWWAAPRAASASAGPGAEADQAPRPRRRAPLRRGPSDEPWATGRGSGRSLRRACTRPCTWCCVLQCWCSCACINAHAQAHMPTHVHLQAYASSGLGGAQVAFDEQLKSSPALVGKPSTYIQASECLHACGADAAACADVLFDVLETKLPDFQTCRVVRHNASLSCRQETAGR